MKRTLWRMLIVTALLASLFGVLPALAVHPVPDGGPVPDQPSGLPGAQVDDYAYPIDEPNPQEEARLLQRERLLNAGQTAEAAALAKTGTDRALVILVEFAGTDVFTWTAPTNPLTPTTGSTWDPIGKADTNEAVWNAAGTNIIVGDCSKIITQTKVFTYGPTLHNQMPRPISEADRSGQAIWTEDFSNQWFKDFMFGNGITFNYTRTDGSLVNESFIGKSVTNYYKDMSSGTYTLTGDVIGWLGLPHSAWWYGADTCPGARSNPPGTTRPSPYGVIPGAGNSTTMVYDALDAVNAISNTIPGFNWNNYDLDGNGVIDRLWIVHAGYGEEDSPILLNRTDYGEAAMWSHSGSVTPRQVAPGIKAQAYIMMPENGGINVFAHEAAHNIGAGDLYDTAGYGNESSGFWTLMSDSWTGYPIGFEPQAFDPLTLDLWGWLNPAIITDTSQVYTLTLGQASAFSNVGSTVLPNAYRGAKIRLPDKAVALSRLPWSGSYYWWGGAQNSSNARMTTKNPIAISAGVNTLSFDLAYDLENRWDFLWVQVSLDGITWATITNTNTSCVHDPGWIGGTYGFPDDLCGAGFGGFTGRNANWPNPQTQVFTIASPIDVSGYLRLWYMTDWSSLGAGPFVDNVVVTSGSTTIFSDDAESGDANWTYQAPWVRSNGYMYTAQNLYLQWRNVNKNGGYDESLADPRWRFGPANTGLLVWVNDASYTNNTIFSYLAQGVSWGTKGRMLVVDSHSEPYRDPYWVAYGYNNEGGNLTDRSQMRDAPFTLQPTVNFTFTAANGAYTDTQFLGRPAVSLFHDSMGYYPGSEYVSRGPYYPPSTTYKWVTKAWSASTVIPASGPYPVKAPGYIGTGGTGDQEWRFDCSRSSTPGALSCYYYGANTGLGYNGGTGNPGDYGVQYGWHVQLLEEASDHTWAKVKIWNAMKATDQTYAANKTTTSINDTVTYNYQINQNWGSQLSLFACVPLDTAKVDFVPGSGTNGAVPLPMSCASAASALASDQPLSALAADATSAVAAVGWTGGNIGTGVSSPGFSFKVKVKPVIGTLSSNVLLYDQGSWWTTVTAADVPIVPAVQVFLPIILR